jgi:hypothetical protein
MEHLRGCRVVVVDDKPEEAEPIIRALGLKGIPVAYFKISPEDDPPKNPCPPGVRLAILDIELGYNLTGENQTVKFLLRVLNQIISKENGPYMVVLWTNYPGEKESFDGEIFREDSLPNPVVSVMLDKSKYGNNLSAIGDKLEEELSKLACFRILQFWEEASFNAATEVTNRLCEIVDPKAPNLQEWIKDWDTGASQLIRAMACEEYGEGLAEPRSALAAFCTSLNPLHGDRMENLTADPPEALVESWVQILKEGDCQDEKRARINAMLHVATEGLGREWAGNMYPLPEDEKWKGHFPQRDELVGEFLADPRNMEAASKTCAPILVEISPICDHAQDKVRVFRLLGGILAPTEQHKFFKQPQRKGPEFLWKLQRLHLSKGVPTPGVFDLYLSARLFYSLSKERSRELTPTLRLRTQACTALQAWFSAHASRVGLFLLRPPEKTS